MWRFPTQSADVSQGMVDTLTKMCGQGRRFYFTLSGTREQQQTSAAGFLAASAAKPMISAGALGSGNVTSATKVLIVNLATDVVLVLNNSPLSVGLNGEKMLLRQFKIIQPDFAFIFEGLEFDLGENVSIRLGKMRRVQGADVCEFCDIRWSASASWEPCGMSLELLQKIAPPALLASRKAVTANFAKIPNQVPFGAQHQALQFVKLYEDVTMERGIVM